LVHSTLKESVVSPLLKKPTLNTEDLSNYRPISNLSLIYKITQRVVKSRLTIHLSSNNLLNPHGATENARLENEGQKMQGRKVRDWKMEHKNVTDCYA